MTYNEARNRKQKKDKRLRGEDEDCDYTGNGHQKKYKRWQNINADFRCGNCKEMVFIEAAMGTTQRNHCNICLWSMHLDTKPGNRASLCRSRMEPVALTFKHNGLDKFGSERHGDIMLVHLCKGCAEVNINRIASDDSSVEIMNVFERSFSLDKSTRATIAQKEIVLLQPADRDRLETALYGKPLCKTETARVVFPCKTPSP